MGLSAVVALVWGLFVKHVLEDDHVVVGGSGSSSII